MIEYLSKSEHIAKWGIRSWLEARLREEGIIVASTIPLNVLEAILARVEAREDV